MTQVLPSPEADPSLGMAGNISMPQPVRTYSLGELASLQVRSLTVQIEHSHGHIADVRSQFQGPEDVTELLTGPAGSRIDALREINEARANIRDAASERTASLRFAGGSTTGYLMLKGAMRIN